MWLQVKYCLLQGIDVNHQHASTGETALSLASQAGHAITVKTLLAAGAAANRCCHRGLSPLMRACAQGQASTTRVCACKHACIPCCLA